MKVRGGLVVNVGKLVEFLLSQSEFVPNFIGVLLHFLGMPILR